MTTPPEPPPPAPLPGWYPDPSCGPGLRYWDGQQWTAVAPASSPAKPLQAMGSPVTSSLQPGEPGTNTNRRDWIVGSAVVVVITVGLVLFMAFREPPPDEGAYINAVFTSKFDHMFLPEKPYIERGYKACAALREGRTEDEATVILQQGETWSKNSEPEKVRERLLEQVVAAHQHLCPRA